MDRFWSRSLLALAATGLFAIVAQADPAEFNAISRRGSCGKGAERCRSYCGRPISDPGEAADGRLRAAVNRDP